MTKDETLLVFTLVVSSVSVFLFGILLFMVLISATRDFRERTKSKLVKIMIWAGHCGGLLVTALSTSADVQTQPAAREHVKMPSHLQGLNVISSGSMHLGARNKKS